MTDERKDQLTAEADGLIEGRNAVIEALRTEASIDKIFIQKGETDKTLGHIASKARAAGIVVVEADRRKLDGMSRTHAHQGVIALAAVREYVSVEDILADAAAKNEKPLIVVCDEISDPHNLGAIIRTAYCAGAHGVIIPKRRGVGLTSAVFKSSAGAAAHIPVARVANLSSTVDELKEKGVWVYGCDMEGETWCSVNFDGGVALIIGSEGKGMSRLLKEKCDVMVSLPMLGEATSLIASVAGGIIMYEVARQRLGLKAVNPKG